MGRKTRRRRQMRRKWVMRMRSRRRMRRTMLMMRMRRMRRRTKDEDDDDDDDDEEEEEENDPPRPEAHRGTAWVPSSPPPYSVADVTAVLRQHFGLTVNTPCSVIEAAVYTKLTQQAAYRPEDS
eukprot:9332538-Pyramimonas_sp.AAC.1